MHMGQPGYLHVMHAMRSESCRTVTTLQCLAGGPLHDRHCDVLTAL